MRTLHYNFKEIIPVLIMQKLRSPDGTKIPICWLSIGRRKVSRRLFKNWRTHHLIWHLHKAQVFKPWKDCWKSGYTSTRQPWRKQVERQSEKRLFLLKKYQTVKIKQFRTQKENDECYRLCINKFLASENFHKTFTCRLVHLYKPLDTVKANALLTYHNKQQSLGHSPWSMSQL